MNRKNSPLYIRTDANETIGTGHVMRCLSIAQAMRRRGTDVIFLAADSRTEGIAAEQGFSTVCLHSVWNDLEQELETLTRFLQENEAALLLVDSYYVTPRYLEALGRYTRLAYIDDLELSTYPADLLIRYAIYSEKGTGRTGSDILAGCAYAPLKQQFLELGKRGVSEPAARILVLTGGTDPYHVALRLASHVVGAEKYRRLRFDIVCGRYSQDREELCRLAAETEQILVHFQVDHMEDLMQAADLAVTAGGTTLYELCACGTPSVCYVLADNQIRNAQTFAEKGLMLYGGDVRQEGWLAQVLGQMGRLVQDRALRENMAEKMQRLVDGRGAERIAEALGRLAGQKREYDEKRDNHDSIWTSDDR